MIFLLSLLAASVVAFVLFPVFAGGDDSSQPIDSASREIRSLTEQKARLLEVIKDLEFDRDSGKISVTEFERSNNDYMAQIAIVLDRLDSLGKQKPANDSAAAKKTNKRRDNTATAAAVSNKSSDEPSNTTKSCAACQQASPSSAKFCAHCGENFALESSCEHCGEALPKSARFCIHCGSKRAVVASSAQS